MADFGHVVHREAPAAASCPAIDTSADDAAILADDATWDAEPEYVAPALFDAEAEYASRFRGR